MLWQFRLPVIELLDVDVEAVRIRIDRARQLMLTVTAIVGCRKWYILEEKS